tara:strand:- start:299 stop:562 length:264 start_codon:yes stop_codon:yes gene_type:complete
MKNTYKLILGFSFTIFLLIFITIKMDCHAIKNDIISLKMKKRIIEDSIKVLKSKETHLLSKNRIESIVEEKFRMYSPSPESLVVVIR